MTKETGLASTDGDAVTLKSVHIDGTLNGLMLHITTKQSYVNQSRKNIEAVYTFPLPAHAVLLGTRLTIGGKTLIATVMEKSEAEDEYEEAIQEGDLPVMIERSGPGLYTANVGNLKRGEEVEIEVQWAQLQNVRDSAVRIAIPTVIGERYGDAHATGGLAPHQTDQVDPLAEYPLTMTLAIEGEIAKSNITCASHIAQISSSGTNEDLLQVVSIVSDAYMDRDVVITLSDLQSTHFGLAQVSGQAATTVLASFCPQLPTTASPLALKILVDCSGSMEGDAIDQAREAVHQVMQQLEIGDYVSYSRFGNLVAHNFNKPVQADEKRRLTPEIMLPATDRKIANIGRLIRSTKADLGGTELEMAAVSTIHDIQLPGEVGTMTFVPTLLLITDGDVWNHEGVVRAAKNSGHRIFAIGVGSAPAESLLRELAETTGGACEFVSPNESMSEAALRLVMRMRAATAARLSVDWGASPSWQSVLPTTVFDSETLHIFATFDSLPTSLPVLNVSIEGKKTSTSLPRMDQGGENMDRMAAAQRLLAESSQAALQTALQYSLISEQTNLLLVHVRENEDKTTELPNLEQIKQMMAAGHSGFGTARDSKVLYCLNPKSLNTVAFSKRVLDNQIPPARSSQLLWLRNPTSSASAHHQVLQDSGLDNFNIPDYLRRQTTANAIEAETTPQQMVAIFNEASLKVSSLDEALEFVREHLRGENVHKIISALSDQIGDEYDALAILLLWVSEVKQLKECRLQRHALRLLDASLKSGVAPDVIKTGYEYLVLNMKFISNDEWGQESVMSA